MESKVNSFLKVGFNVFFNYSENPTGSFEALRSAYRARPTGVAYYDQLVNPADGYDATIDPFNGLAVWMGIKDSQVMNPLIEADPSNYQFQINARNQMGNAYAEITLLKNTLNPTFKKLFTLLSIAPLSVYFLYVLCGILPSSWM